MSRSRDIANLLGAGSELSNKIDKSVVDAKGDILIGSGDNTVTRLAAGSTGQIPIIDSSTSSGLRYVDPPTNRNMIINGGMQVSQRGTSVTGTVTFAFLADRFALVANNMGTWTQTIENDAPAGTGLRKSLRALCTTADASPAASDRVQISTIIEGQDLQRIRKGTASAQSLTLSFWTKSNVTGTYTAWLYDADNNRLVSGTYNITAPATWESKSITFPSDVVGAFDNDNMDSLYIAWGLGMGTDFTSGTLQTTWATYVAANRNVGQVNLAAAINNYWQITGVQLETGTTQTPFEFEPYETTLMKCQRYYTNFRSNESSAGLNYFRIASGQNQTTTQAQFALPLPVKMRTSPTLVQSSTPSEFAVFANNTITPLSSAMGINSHPQVINITVPVASGLVAGQGSQLIVNNNRNAWFALDAEL